MTNSEMNKVDIIIPVYAGLEETKECLLSTIATFKPEIGNLIVINDSSPEPELVQWLIDTEQQHNFTLLHNKENLGFVATVNRGMQLNPDNDVLLLNSDVEVAGDWLSRLREAAYTSDNIASLTPFSNNATICSFPNFCEDNQLIFDLSVEAIDAHFSRLFTATDQIDIPTAIGFCMYIKRNCLDKIGYFDVDTFGRGYGEENDWCQRAEKAGWKNYLQTNVFAYHKGGVSFDLEQDHRKTKALELLAAKHPDYDQKVQKFITADPIKRFRMEALWKLVAKTDLPKIIFVTHRMGGGVQQHIDELVNYYSGQALFLKLAPIEDGKSVGIAIFDSNGSLLHDAASYQVDTDYDHLLEILKALGISRVHFHHTMGLHPKIWSLASGLNCNYDITIHDYYLVNGNPTLIDGSARFAGDFDTQKLDNLCSQAYPIPVTGTQWRENHKDFLEKAERVIFPSLDTCQRFTKFFDLEKTYAAWHPDSSEDHTYPEVNFKYSYDNNLKVLILGALSREKGADVLEQVAIQLVHDKIEFHLLGYAYRALDKAVITHGPFDNTDVLELIKAIDPDIVWFPAQWPETYSYTLSSALKMGMAVVVPNIGAFPERITGRNYSIVKPWDFSVNEWTSFWRDIQSGAIEQHCNIDCTPSPLPINKTFYSSSEYLKLIPRLLGNEADLNIDNLMGHYRVEQNKLTFREKCFGVIYSLSRLPIMSKMIGYIPFKMKRKVKRLFSRRPVHEIIKD